MPHFFTKEQGRVSSGVPDSKVLQLGCLVGACTLILLFIIFYTSVNRLFLYYVDTYIILPAALFWGISMTRKEFWAHRGSWILCMAAPVWFIISETFQRSTYGGTQSISIFFAMYLLPLPFALFSGDGQDQKGLALAGGFYLFYTLGQGLRIFLCLLDFLPGFALTSLPWDGARLLLVCHPNVTAGLFMVGLGFDLWFFSRSRSWKGRVLWGAGMGLLLLCIALTNSRTTVLITGAFLGAFLFFHELHRGWKRMLLALVVGLAFIPLYFNLAKEIYQWNEARLIQSYMAQETAAQQAGSSESQTPLQVNPETGEVSLQTVTTSGQGDFTSNLTSFNGRTRLWKTALQVVKENPDIALRGTSDVIATMTSYLGFEAHTHNSWFQILLRRGIPGLAIALVFTLLAFRDGLILLFRRGSSSAQRAIALLVLGILGISIMEPYLFTGDINYFYVEFVFFLGFGYLQVWYHQGRKAPTI